MLYNTFDDTIMEPIGWLFEVLSGCLLYTSPSPRDCS